MPNVFCDMDGVLVDLLEGYRQVAGQCLTELHGVGDEKWNPALEVENFWINLPKMHDADELLEHFEAAVPDHKLHVLSAPQHLFPDCDVQKLKWLELNTSVFNMEQAIVIDRKRKREFAVQPCGKPNILIDDYHKNITEWTEAGGIGILHVNARDTIEQLEAALTSFDPH